jgi:UDP-N-acetylmuramyl pentapeptide phosphotransferase/UDP-N-acetylglucosamine-1-phosphate transferase
LIISLINGFNLIDGVDGLASGIGILVSMFLGLWFLLSGHYTYAVLCFSLLGSLSAYFIFNVFGNKNKIFMGDTGSMIIGLIISIFTIKFLEFENQAASNLQFSAAPALAFGLLIIPLFDTLRIIILRIRNGESPFKADRNHVHHNLLKLGYSHLKVTSLTIIINLLFIIMALSLQRLGSVVLILITLSLAVILSTWLDLILKKRKLR